MQVLLVEDQPELAQRMAQGLSEAGFGVEVAANGMAAQRFVESTVYDLVILDVMLPGLNAWKLQQAIRQRGDTPVLFLTTPGGIEDRLRGLELHEDDYLLKPFEARTLVARVRKLLRRDRGR
ncbi:response regulator [Pseudomonas trivialis]|jgi:two-component system copper resistance phosphate regulon response regulator CusR|uniref:response regulator n=1 Tax=Pseudomonas TaxID=286 RepID=UPI001AE2FCAB|nr:MULTISPECIES: response regulator [unclassified Pseudomonas]MBP1127170.1 two-component system copper resistance phosphate regulon response regulator CusR [Pseudomonas sp. PvP025]MDQ0401030.1 two-component system copper resistance phosphate regulon response regulator CusR [Pseudomonas sp. PvP006]MEB0106066.1 response regulator [Pseudomonas sp. MH9.3]WPX78037.1 response regulator [Pseudomonas sp. MH9.3]